MPVFMNHVVIYRHCHVHVNKIMLNVSCVLMDHMVFCIQNKLVIAQPAGLHYNPGASPSEAC